MAPSRISATSSRCTGFPAGEKPTTKRLRSAADLIASARRTRASVPFVTVVPKGPAEPAARTAAVTLAKESPKLSSLAGSISTISSRSRPPMTSTVEMSSSPISRSRTSQAIRLSPSSPYFSETRETARMGTSSTSALFTHGPSISAGSSARPPTIRSASLTRDSSLFSPTLNCTTTTAAESTAVDQ